MVLGTINFYGEKVEAAPACSTPSNTLKDWISFLYVGISP